MVGVQIPEAALQAVVEGISGEGLLPAQPSGASAGLVSSSAARKSALSSPWGSGLPQHKEVKPTPAARPAVKYFPWGSKPYQAKAGRTPSTRAGPVDVIVID